MTLFRLSIVSLVVIALSSCGAAQTLIKKRNLDVQTKMSSTIFLEPVANSKKIAYVNVRNTSDKQLFIEGNVKSLLTNKGYTLVQDPAKANFMLQANVLKVGKSDLRETQEALDGGFGGALLGSTFAGDSEVARRNSTLVGGVLGLVGDALVTDILYTMITDIQVRERPLAGETITQNQNSDLKQGSSTTVSQSSQGAKVQWKTYRSRIVSTANQSNLSFQDAKSRLEEGLTRSISGIF